MVLAWGRNSLLSTFESLSRLYPQIRSLARWGKDLAYLG
jgi:hypothetical protein